MTEQVALGGAPTAARRAEQNVREVARMLMAAKRVDAAVLATVIGVSRASTYERLSGRRPFSIGELAAMADYFNVPPAVFLAGPDVLLHPGMGAVSVRKLPARHESGHTLAGQTGRPVPRALRMVA